MFSPAKKSLSTNRNAFKNTFPTDGKIKLAVAGASQNGRKKLFPLARKSVKVIFRKLDLPVSTNRTNISKWKNIVSTTHKVGFH